MKNKSIKWHRIITLLVISLPITLLSQNSRKKFEVEFMTEFTSYSVQDRLISTDEVYRSDEANKTLFSGMIKYNLFNMPKLKFGPILGYTNVKKGRYPLYQEFMALPPDDSYSFIGVFSHLSLFSNIKLGAELFIPIEDRGANDFFSLRPSIIYTLIDEPFNSLSLKLGYAIYFWDKVTNPGDGLTYINENEVSFNGVSASIIYNFTRLNLNFKSRSKVWKENEFRDN